MVKGFWENLKKPIIGLSPMDGVTDAAFRFMNAKYGKPAVILTEFTAAEGIRAGALRLLDDFIYAEEERPVVAQLFGSDPHAFFISALVTSALGFDGIDINMGCPAKSVAERGAGAALIRDPERAKEIIRQTRAGNQAWAEGALLEDFDLPENMVKEIYKRNPLYNRRLLPVSVKTRIGYDTICVEEWVQHLLEEAPVTITLHGRTLKQLYTGLADWEAIGRGAALIKKTDTLVLGNGDIQTRVEAEEKSAHYKLDGALIGRAAYGNPWVFNGHLATLAERQAAALEHARTFVRLFPQGHFLRMRKHLLDYAHGFEGAKELRQKLMRVNSLAETETILSSEVWQ